MRIIFGLVLIIGVALAGFAVYMTRDYLATFNDQLEAERSLNQEAIETEEIYVVTQQVAYGDLIPADIVKLVQWPVASKPEGVFGTEEELFPEGLDAPRVALRPIEAFEPLLAVKVSGAGEDAGVATRLSKGNRAFTIRVDVTSGVSGLLRPGDRVDVYWSGTLPGGRSQVTRLIEASIPLIAIDQSSDNNNRNATVARTVTVEVSPQQVADLAQAQSSGRLTLALVGQGDDSISSNIEVDQNSLFNIEEEAPQEAQGCFVRQLRGGEMVRVEVPCRE